MAARRVKYLLSVRGTSFCASDVSEMHLALNGGETLIVKWTYISSQYIDHRCENSTLNGEHRYETSTLYGEDYIRLIVKYNVPAGNHVTLSRVILDEDLPSKH